MKLLTFSILQILAVLHQVIDSASVRLELRVEPNADTVIENAGLKFTCVAERAANGAKEWYDMEVSITPKNAKEALCYR